MRQIETMAKTMMCMDRGMRMCCCCMACAVEAQLYRELRSEA